MRGARSQFFVMGCPEQVQYTSMDGHVFTEVVLNILFDVSITSIFSFGLPTFSHFAVFRPPVPFEVITILSAANFLPCCLCIHQGMVREPNPSTQTSSSFEVDNACGRKGSSKFGLFRIWYISIFSTKRRALRLLIVRSSSWDVVELSQRVLNFDESGLWINTAIPFSKTIRPQYHSTQISFTCCFDQWMGDDAFGVPCFHLQKHRATCDSTYR